MKKSVIKSVILTFATTKIVIVCVIAIIIKFILGLDFSDIPWIILFILILTTCRIKSGPIQEVKGGISKANKVSRTVAGKL